MLRLNSLKNKAKDTDLISSNIEHLHVNRRCRLVAENNLCSHTKVSKLTSLESLCKTPGCSILVHTGLQAELRFLEVYMVRNGAVE